MCGIFGAVAAKPVADLLVEGLNRLEYRGYDSAGIVTLEDGELKRVCAVGKVDALRRRISTGGPLGQIGIAHTRWATHGAPSEHNSHPHIAPGVAVVHNGIVENHTELRSALKTQGCTFTSETDTEVIPWMISRSIAAGAAPARAMQEISERIEGSYAIGVLTQQDPDVIHARRAGSPLVAAFGDSGGFIASDVAALAGMAKEAVFLEDGDRAEIARDRVTIHDSTGRIAHRRIVRVDESFETLDRGGFAHFMLKEINEQPTVAAAVGARYAPSDAFDEIMVDFRRLDRVKLIACGSSYYACLVARRWLAEVAGLEADVELASEYRYAPVIAHTGNEVAIFLSQSGETADTLACLDKAKSLRIATIGVVNQMMSTLGREADYALPLLAGTEVGVASTKAFLAQLLVMARLVAHIGAMRGHRAAAERFREGLDRVPGWIAATLHNEAAIISVAEHFLHAKSAVFVARGGLYPLALEGALKLKEISYIHAEGFAAGELKHGPIALIDHTTPVVALAPSGELFSKVASNVREIAARGGRITVLGDRRAILSLSDVASTALTIPSCDDLIQPIVAAIPLQLLSYHVAVARGSDVDRPRNLAKSVTVE
ncbi:MAG: Glutamine--fructose-6-phosphate aminotransferase [Hyphomicrobiales bacterium]|nr:Glutamine--fructose-6-phosphate aminotransferase [Hyphomicrobiales bacterium]